MISSVYILEKKGIIAGIYKMEKWTHKLGRLKKLFSRGIKKSIRKAILIVLKGRDWSAAIPPLAHLTCYSILQLLLSSRCVHHVWQSQRLFKEQWLKNEPILVSWEALPYSSPLSSTEKKLRMRVEVEVNVFSFATSSLETETRFIVINGSQLQS